MITRSVVRHCVCFALSATLWACGNKDNADSPQAIHMALIPKAGNNLVFDIGNDGAQFAARDIRFDDKTEVDVEYLAPTELDPSLQKDLIQQAIEANKDALIVSCVDSSISDSIDDAVNAGIPVLTYDSDCPDSKRLGFYSMLSEDTGIKAADLLAQAMGDGPKTVAILTGRAGADNLERRQAAFLGRLADAYPDISVVETVNCMETAESCSPAVEEELLTKYPDLDGLFVVGLWGLLEACSCSDSGMTCICEDNQMPNWKAAAKGKLKTVAYDTLPFELELMAQGYISALIGQKYFGWGYDSVQLMYKHLAHGKTVDSFVDSGFDVVCPNNVDDMQAKWNAADFTEALNPECEF